MNEIVVVKKDRVAVVFDTSNVSRYDALERAYKAIKTEMIRQETIKDYNPTWQDRQY